MNEPNVRAHLVRTRTAPGVPDQVTPLVIWWHGSRFRVRDQTGRPYAQLVADASAARGFGVLPRTMEDFMDAAGSPVLPAGRSHTDLFGDLEQPLGVVDEPWEQPWEAEIAQLKPVAQQLLAGELDGLKPTGEATLLGRSCLEYRTFLDGVEAGHEFRSVVRRLVAGPYVLLREVTDASGDGPRMRTEVVTLEEGVVTEEDVTPPRVGSG